MPAFGWSFYARNVVPIGVLFALSLGFSNLAAVRLSVSFIQMVKALTPLLALGISVYLRIEHLTRALAASASSRRPPPPDAPHARVNPAPRPTPRPPPRSRVGHVRRRNDRVVGRD